MIPEPRVWIGTASGRVECTVLTASIFRGRDDPMTQPLPSTATLELIGPLPAAAVLGAPVGVDAVIGGTAYPRFRGEVTDLTVEWDDVDHPRPRIIATGPLGRTARRVVGDAPWAAELDGARVSRVLTLAGFPPDPLLTDPGTVQVLARDVDAQPAQTLAHEAATDGNGIVWEDVTGRILYADAMHRRGIPVGFELAACDIGVSVAWAQSLEGLVNDAHVRYGVAPDGGEQSEVTARDTASVTARGLYGASLSTRIATVADAQRRADDIVARQSVPAWILEGLEVNLGGFDAFDVLALVSSIDVHDLLSVTGMPAGSPSTSALLWVEGWREVIRGTDGGGLSWTISYATSDYCRTGAPPRWNDLDPALTWATVDPALTWNGAACIPPQPGRGRWDDVAASLRWDQVSPAVSWDAWA